MAQDNTYRKVLKWRDRHRGQVRSGCGPLKLGLVLPTCHNGITALHHAHVRGGNTRQS